MAEGGRVLRLRGFVRISGSFKAFFFFLGGGGGEGLGLQGL